MKESYADVIVDISHEKVDRPFQYRIPEALRDDIYPGVRVMIPFGRGNTLRKGYVIAIKDKAEIDITKIKDICEVPKEGTDATDKMLLLAAWMKEQYGSTMINALKTVLPVKQKTKQLEKKTVCLLLSKEEGNALLQVFIQKHQVARARLLEALLEEKNIPFSILTGKLNVSSAVITALLEKGVLKIESENYYRKPIGEIGGKEIKKTVSEEQQYIIDSFIGDYDKDIRKTYLIHGITGAGKTEVYIQLIEEVINRGKQAIVLIPEIALTYQTVMRFYRHFGDRVSVMNSTLSPGEKYDQCERAKKGDIDVIIGPRSALFTPFPNIGLIVIDEEHETSYKSENPPKYHARETAVEIARLHHASVVLGSATPSLEAYYRAMKGEYQLFSLTKRLTGGMLPKVYTVDLREELRSGNRTVFSRKLQELMVQRLEKKEQIMLFINRRGYAGFVSCRACGHVMKCPHCDVSLSEHRDGKLICHYCGYEQPGVKICPECGSKYIQGFKAGTEQIEMQLKKILPMAKVLRMDADTTKTKESYGKILEGFANQEADILLGTQMIVKGHDFPNVTLVGILAADLSLHMNDYRAGERTFQLLTQAAGRAGRGEKAGEVVIQTYQPEHYSVIHAAKQDYLGFYEEEIVYRELLEYPPAAHMMAVQVVSRNKEAGMLLAQELSAVVIKEQLRVIGPTQATVGKINDIYRHVFYVKNKEYDRLVKIKDTLEKVTEEKKLRNEAVYFDFDPMNSF